MSEFVPFYIDYPGLRGRLNQDRTWSFELRDRAWIDALPDEAFHHLPRTVAERLLDAPDAPPCPNGIPMSSRELSRIACEDPIVGGLCTGSLAANGRCFGDESDELPKPEIAARIHHYYAFYWHLNLSRN